MRVPIYETVDRRSIHKNFESPKKITSRIIRRGWGKKSYETRFYSESVFRGCLEALDCSKKRSGKTISNLFKTEVLKQYNHTEKYFNVDYF